MKTHSIDTAMNGVIQYSEYEVGVCLFLVLEDDAWYQLRDNDGDDRLKIVTNVSSVRTGELPVWLQLA